MLQVETDKVVRGLIAQIFSLKKNRKLPKYAIHKVLFKLRVTLPRDSPVRNYLPFYWYNYGPFSDLIEANISTMVQYDMLKEHKSPEEKPLLELVKDIPLPEVAGIKEAERSLSSIVKQVDFYHLYSFVDEIYRTYAPCSFMPLFKLDFLNELEGYVERRSSGQRTINEYVGFYPDLDKLENVLYDCEAELPSAPIFKPFNNLFSAFVTNTGRVVDNIRNNEITQLYLSEQVLHTAEETWKSFAKGIRILDAGHDEYYENRLETWNSLYNKSLIDYSIHLDNFNSRVLSEIKSSKLYVVPHSEKSKNILSSVVEGYLM